MNQFIKDNYSKMYYLRWDPINNKPYTRLFPMALPLIGFDKFTLSIGGKEIELDVNKKVNTLIFPNLDAANITYKLLKELNKAESIGPIILGLDKPVHVFQLGASVEEMVNMAAVAVVDAQEKNRKQNR